MLTSATFEVSGVKFTLQSVPNGITLVARLDPDLEIWREWTAKREEFRTARFATSYTAGTDIDTSLLHYYLSRLIELF